MATLKMTELGAGARVVVTLTCQRHPRALVAVSVTGAVVPAPAPGVSVRVTSAEGKRAA